MNKKNGRVICITGIDTDIGKTIVTGLLARHLAKGGNNVITQKICQTGCVGISEDIVLHREIMDISLTEADLEGLTCPYVFTEPCSPHLAANLDGKQIDPDYITKATEQLRRQYDFVIVEGVGGLMVPLLADLTLVDYFYGLDYSHVLVSSSRLGSINHTLSALEIMHSRKLLVEGLVYNNFQETHEAIVDDSARIFKLYLRKYGYPEKVIPMSDYKENGYGSIDFSSLIKQYK